MPDDTKSSKKNAVTADDKALFRQAIKGTKVAKPDNRVRPLGPDTSAANKFRTRHARQAATADLTRARQESATHPFSSHFEPALPEGVMKYSADQANPYLTKQLRRGDFVPDLIVDLHGLTQVEAQRDLAEAVRQCIQDQGLCMNVIHGVGTGVLRQRVPGWLMQHPDVIAFHQAPLEWGGQGALLVLLKTTALDWRDPDFK